MSKFGKLSSPKEKGDTVFYIFNTLILGAAFLAVIYPLIYIVSASFSSPFAVTTGRVWLLPVDFTVKGYQAVFNHKDILTGYKNSTIYASIGTILNVILTVAAAYPLSRKEFKARSFYMKIFVITMFFHGGLIPTYLLMNDLQLINTRAIMILTAAINVYNMIITRTFFQTNIPDELIEAARIDGMGDIRILIKIVLPLSKSIIAVITLFYAVNHWNHFFAALIYLNDKKLFPLQIVLRNILVLNQVDYSMMENISLEEITAREGLAELLKFSLIIVASLPVLMLYPFVQKYFVKGVMIGSLKG